MYDYLIVGAGMFGSVFAHEQVRRGKKVLVIDQRAHTGGNCHSELKHDIHCSAYGPHVFHTDRDEIWQYVSERCAMRPFTYTAKACYHGQLFSFPINMATMSAVYGVSTPDEARKAIASDCVAVSNQDTVENWCLANIGARLYTMFVSGYTSKQWRRPASELPAAIIRRLPVRFTYHEGYYTDKYSGYPDNGYSELFSNLLAGSDVQLRVDYFSDRERLDRLANRVVYTGKIDQLCGYTHGELDYLSLRFDDRVADGDLQGCATVNYTQSDVAWTRIVEHKHFRPHSSNSKTVYTVETPVPYARCETEPCYPVNTEANQQVFAKYQQQVAGNRKLILGGRLAEYRYYDMDDVISSALRAVCSDLTG